MIDISQLTADPVSMEWGFWTHWADGRWEPKTKWTIDTLVRDGTYVDIGAWVGPTVLWACEHASRIVAIEPDPDAYPMLRANLNAAAYGADIVYQRCAVAAIDGPTTVGSSGNSMTRTGEGGSTVDAFTIATLFDQFDVTEADLIKIDIEGAEREVLAEAEPFLHDFGAPLLLSVHPWARFDLEAALKDRWLMINLDFHDADDGLGEWLLVPC